ncbi:MAG: hypothetical protein ACRDK1_09135 [Solirubrobacterales bacterium]
MPVAVGRTAGAVSGIAESAPVRRLTRGRLWIGLLATLLVGIVALNVLSLSYNATASRSAKQVDTLKREISILRAQISKAGASEQHLASQGAQLGLIVPEPGAIAYLRPKPGDAAAAAQRLASGAVSAGGSSVTTTPPVASPATAPPSTAPGVAVTP